MLCVLFMKSNELSMKIVLGDLRKDIRKIENDIIRGVHVLREAEIFFLLRDEAESCDEAI